MKRTLIRFHANTSPHEDPGYRRPPFRVPARWGCWFGIALSAVALAQGPFTYTDSTKSLVLRSHDGSLELLPNSVYRFHLRTPGGQVYAASKTQGLEMYATEIVADAVSQKGAEANTIKAATLTGGIRAIRTVGIQRSEMTGSAAKYVVDRGVGVLTVTGPVKLVTSDGGTQSLVASGSSLRATLTNGASKNSLQTATITGPVHINVRQAAKGAGQPTNLTVVAQRVILDNSSKSPTLTLIGGVTVNGIAGGGHISGGLGRAVFDLNQRGEVVKFEFHGGSG